MKDNAEILTLDGGVAIDDRGQLKFVNGFTFKKVKRFYQVESHNTTVIRAWHGHKHEGKYVYVAKGAIILGAVKLTSLTKPKKRVRVERIVLSADKPQVVYIPPGFANGFRALMPGTIVMFYSTATLEESKKDDYRFPDDYLEKGIWQVENR